MNLACHRQKRKLLWVLRAIRGLTQELKLTDSTYGGCLLRIVKLGILCANPQAGEASLSASLFDLVISIRNPAFLFPEPQRQRNGWEKQIPRSFHSPNLCFSRGRRRANCSIEKAEMCPRFCAAELWPVLLLYADKCGLVLPGIQPARALSWNVLIKWILQISLF